MKKLIELGNQYAEQSDWTDFALVKFCLCAMGVLIGVTIPKKNKRAAQAIAASIFGGTYFILMRKVIKIIIEMKKENLDL